MRPLPTLVLSLLLLLGTGAVHLLAQLPTEAPSIRLSVYNNATLLPGAGKLGVWGEPAHPGVAANYNWQWASQSRHPWGQTVQLAYHYHRYVQHSVSILTALEKHFLLGGPWQLGLELGGGYLRAYHATAAYQLNETSGQYEALRNTGRGQWVVTTGLAPRYVLSERLTVFLRYQFYLQGTFVHEYVPVLPNTALHLGLQYYLPTTK